MRWEFHPEARVEFLESVAFFESRSPGLGSAFANEIELGLRNILDAPERWRLMEQDVRRCLVRRFPYGILYSIETGFILIIAVMHCVAEPVTGATDCPPDEPTFQVPPDQYPLLPPSENTPNL